MKYEPADYIATWLIYATNLKENPIPPDSLQCDDWNTALLSEHTVINTKRGLYLSMQAHELFMRVTNTLPPQEYFDKTYCY